jgi:hypothetical protein
MQGARFAEVHFSIWERGRASVGKEDRMKKHMKETSLVTSMWEKGIMDLSRVVTGRSLGGVRMDRRLNYTFPVNWWEH